MEKIEDLIFCEVIVKDGEKIRFVDSGVRTINRKVENREVIYEYSSSMNVEVSIPDRYSYKIDFIQTADTILLDLIRISVNPAYFLSA